MIIKKLMYLNNLKFAFKTRRVWWYTATSRTRARFARTALGSFWLGLSNLLSIATLGIVYGTVFAVQDFRAYFIYLGIGLVIWNTISASVSSSPQLFSVNAQNIKNLNLSPLFYTLEEWAFQIQTFLQSFSLVFVVLVFFDKTLINNFLLYSWLPLVNLIIFIYWFPLLICLMGVRFSDFSQLVPIVLQLFFLISPILYMKESLGKLGWITNINFVYIVLDSLRLSIIKGLVDYQSVLIIFVINLVGLFLSLALLNKQISKLPFLV